MKEFDSHTLIGPGDDDYGRKIPFWKKPPYNQKEMKKEEKQKEVKAYMEMLETISKVKDFNVEDFGIKSIMMVNEILTNDPMKPLLLIKKIDGTEYKINGMQNIVDHINEIFFAPLKELKKVMDKCINCGCDTIYPINMHVDFRMNFVEGAGQLCEKCYHRIYLK